MPLLFYLMVIFPRVSVVSVALFGLWTLPKSTAWTPRTLSRSQHFNPLENDGTPRSLQRKITRRQKKRLRSSLRLSSKDQAIDGAPQFLLYNSLTRRKNVFQPIHKTTVTMYTCGPTVYDFAHVGNFRAFLTYDLVKRVLTYLGYDVQHVCNLTDVDDKIIQRANELRLSDVSELTRKYEELFMKDLQALNIWPAQHYPRATDHVWEMLQMIRQLHTKDLAYETEDGSWYFRTQSQEGYGQQLVQLKYDEMMEQSDGDTNAASSIQKEHFADFCLWKAFKEGVDREDAAWSSEDFTDRQEGSNVDPVVIAKGRPGWHLECSAMARKFFGDETIDLHGGGIDLKFPHHENEIAQSQGATGNRFCNCWFHNGFVNLDNEKMSKSLGNFLTLRTACPTPDEVRAYRYLVVSSQYRNPLAFTPECMKAAKNAIKRLDKVLADLEEALQDGNPGDVNDNSIAETIVPEALENFELALADDLSMPRAAASLFALVKAAEQEFKRVAKDDTSTLDLAGLEAIQSAMQQMDRVFGIFYEVPVSVEEAKAEAARAEDAMRIPDAVMDLVSQRSAAKQAKDWEMADSLRKRILELGFAVKDVKDGEPIVCRLEV